MEWLRRRHPEFFNDVETRRVAAAVVRSMADELVPLSPLRRASIVAGVIALMYKMGTAAIKSVGDPEGRKMGRIFADMCEKE
jgi:hypothetical protein